MSNIRYLMLLLLMVSMNIQAIEQRNYLQHHAAVLTDEEILLDSYKPFPEYSDREYWNALPVKVRELCIQKGEQSLKYTFGTVSLTSYLDYKRSGSRASGEKFYNNRSANLRNLILAELCEGKGRFLDAIMDASWSVCEQTYWGIAAHLTLVKEAKGVPDITQPYVDLVAGEMANLLGWSYYFFHEAFDKVSPQISKRIQYEMMYKVTRPYLDRNDFWWMATTPGAFVNNWNPWCNFNVVQATLLTCDDRKTKLEVLHKSFRSVDQFINYYKSDGGCEEGPSYWGHAAGMLMEYLELLSDISHQKMHIFDKELIRNMGYYISNSYISDDQYTNFADAQAINSGFSDLVYRYGKNSDDTRMKQFGAFLEQQAGDTAWLSGSLDRVLHHIKLYSEIRETVPNASQVSYAWMDGIQQTMSRSEAGSNKGYFFAAKGGSNGESHNHNDVGTFILYYNGDPILIDAGVGTYTSKTFSSKRYELWHTQSAYHNLPLINGHQQMDGSTYKAVNVKNVNTSKATKFTMDISTAYPKEADCKFWVRSYDFNRTKGLTIQDQYELGSVKVPNELNFLIRSGVEEFSKGKMLLKGKTERLILHYDPAKFKIVSEKIMLDDQRFIKVWGSEIYRLKMIDIHPEKQGNYKIRITNF